MTQQIHYAVPRGAIYAQQRSRVDAVRFGLALPNALALAVAIGAAYGYVEPQLHQIHFRIGAVIATALVLGLLTGAAIRFSKLSNRAMAVLFGTLVGFIGLWASWVSWMHGVLVARGFDVSVSWLLNPAFLLRLMRAISRTGVWRYGSTNVNGGQLVFYWVVEALALVAGCALVGAAMTGTASLVCPACRKPSKGVGGLGRFNGEDTDAVRSHMESHDFDYLLTLGPPPDDNAPEVIPRLECCPCGETNLLSVRRVAWGFNAQGGRVLTERTLVDGLALTPEQVDAVKSLKARLSAATDPPDDDDGEPTDTADPSDADDRDA